MTSPSVDDAPIELAAGDVVILDESPAPPAPAPGLSPEVRRRKQIETHVVYLVLAAAVLVLAMTMTRRGEEQVILPLMSEPLPQLCHMKRFTGFDCPGCGLTRSFISLGHGDLAAAWHFNPAGILLFAITALQVPYRTWQLWRIRTGRDEWYFPGFANWQTMIVVAALVLQWIVRMVSQGTAG